MTIAPASVRLFRLAVHLWLIVFLVLRIPAGEFLWVYPVSPTLPGNGFFSWATDAFDTWLPGGMVYVAVPLLLALAVRNLFRPARWYVGLLVWILYVSLMHRAWLAGSGGQQLMGVLLFWSIFIDERSLGPAPSFRSASSVLGVWAVRLQLLLVYAATAAHKATGTAWWDGTAVGVVATDAAYHLGGLAHLPWLCRAITWLLFAFMALFPVAVWWRPARRLVLAAGLVFHAATAVFLDIPEMGTAFLVAYALWLDADEAAHFLRPFAQLAALRRRP